MKAWDRYREVLLSITELAARLYIAKVFFMAGLSKTNDWAMTIEMFTDEYRVPLLSPTVAAYLGTGGELLFSSLLALGLIRPLAALGLFALNIVAVISYYHVIHEMPVSLQDHLEWGLLLALLVSLPTTWLSADKGLQIWRRSSQTA